MPVLRKGGHVISVSVDMTTYQERLELFQFYLMARIILSKGDTFESLMISK